MSTNTIYIKCTYDGAGNRDLFLAVRDNGRLFLTDFTNKHIWVKNVHINDASLFQLKHLHTEGNFMSSSKRRFRAIISGRQTWLKENENDQKLINTRLNESRFLGIRKKDGRMFWINEANISQGFTQVICEFISTPS